MDHFVFSWKKQYLASKTFSTKKRKWCKQFPTVYFYLKLFHLTQLKLLLIPSAEAAFPQLIHYDGRRLIMNVLCSTWAQYTSVQFQSGGMNLEDAYNMMHQVVCFTHIYYNQKLAEYIISLQFHAKKIIFKKFRFYTFLRWKRWD